MNKNTIYQYSTINGLFNGYFDGQISLKEVSKRGDIGLGCFNGIDGELMQLDGKFYRFDTKGELREASLDEHTPFICTVPFESQKTVEIGRVNSMHELNDVLDKEIDKKNNFYVFKIHGNFEYIKTRSEEKQERPYGTLMEVLSKQIVFEYENISGTLIVFYTPEYAAKLNVPGYHYHFVSDDKKIGGHILNLKIISATAHIDSIGSFQMELPQTEEFHNIDLNNVKVEDVRAIESDEK